MGGFHALPHRPLSQLTEQSAGRGPVWGKVPSGVPDPQSDGTDHQNRPDASHRQV